MWRCEQRGWRGWGGDTRLRQELRREDRGGEGEKVEGDEEHLVEETEYEQDFLMSR